MGFEQIGIAAKSGQPRYQTSPQFQPPVTGRFHLLLHQFERSPAATIGKILFAVFHLKSTFHSESFAIRIRFQHQQRGVGRDDVILFGERDDLVSNGGRGALLEQGVQISEEDIGQLKAARAMLVAKIDALISSVDVLAIPSAPLPAMALEDFPPQAVLPPETVAEFVTFTAPLNFSGHPTLSAPCGFSKEDLPLSLQLVGQRQALQFGLQRGNTLAVQ